MSIGHNMDTKMSHNFYIFSWKGLYMKWVIQADDV